jgi:hypothetical protein
MNIDFKAIVNEAFDYACVATKEWIERNPNCVYPCGFSNVVIRPARGPLITYMKKNDIGCKNYSGGWLIWNPSGNATQSMYAKEVGAVAFASVLRKHGFGCSVQTRLD